MATTVAGVTDNAGNIYSEAGSAKSIDTGSNLMADLWYAKNSRAGATVVTITAKPGWNLRRGCDLGILRS